MDYHLRVKPHPHHAAAQYRLVPVICIFIDLIMRPSTLSRLRTHCCLCCSWCLCVSLHGSAGSDALHAHITRLSTSQLRGLGRTGGGCRPSQSISRATGDLSTDHVLSLLPSQCRRRAAVLHYSAVCRVFLASAACCVSLQRHWAVLASILTRLTGSITY